MTQANAGTAEPDGPSAAHVVDSASAGNAGRLTRLSRALADRFGIIPAFRWKKLIRLAGVMTLDFTAIAATLLLLQPLLDERAEIRVGLVPFPAMVAAASAVAVLIMFLAGLYRRNWRFTSLADCLVMGLNVAIALAIVWVGIWFLAERAYSSHFLLLAILHFCLSFLAMQVMRLSRRAARRLPIFTLMHAAPQSGLVDREKVVLVGRADWVDSVISITAPDRASPITIVGILLPEADGPIAKIRGVPVLGFPENLLSAVMALEQRKRRPDTIIVCDDAINLSARVVASVSRVTKDLGIKIVKVGDDWGHLLGRKKSSALEKLSTTELLGRREFELREATISKQVAGETILVTGAGGTIGGELTRQLAAFNPGTLVLLDHSEYNLYTIERQIREVLPGPVCRDFPVRRQGSW